MFHHHKEIRTGLFTLHPNAAPKPPELYMKNLVDTNPRFAKFVGDAGIKLIGDQSLCTGEQALQLTRHYYREYIEAYKELRETVLAYDHRLTMETWFDLEGLFEMPPVSLDKSWRWFVDGKRNLAGMAVLLFAVFSKVTDTRVVAYLEHPVAGRYRIGIQFIGSPDFEIFNL
jgi:hypothetical protein